MNMYRGRNGVPYYRLRSADLQEDALPEAHIKNPGDGGRILGKPVLEAPPLGLALSGRERR
jgi:hypothetical protein